jgi:PAS domain S-box-containing protein
VHRSLGFSQDEIVGTNIAQVVHADDLELALQRLQSLAADETAELTTLRVIARNGSVHWIEISSGRLQNPIAGGTVLTCRDVTGRHAVEADAATRVSHLRYAFEVAQAALDLEVDEFLIGLSGVCANIARMLGVDLVYVDRIDEQQHLITNLAGWVGNGAVQRVSPGGTLPCARLPLWVERLRCLEPIVMNDAAASSEPWAIEKLEALGSEGGLMAIAMSAAGELFGVFGVSMRFCVSSVRPSLTSWSGLGWTMPCGAARVGSGRCPRPPPTLCC